MKKSVLIIAAFLFFNSYFVNAQNYSTTCHASNQGHHSYHKKKKVNYHGSYYNHHSQPAYACCAVVHQPVHYPSHHPGHNMHRYISDSQMHSIIYAINEESFSSSKMNIAKQATRNRLISSSQVAQIAGLFSFESDRLAFAKYAYNFTYDKNNYYLVNSVFSFNSSKNELNQYIMQKF